MIARSYRPVAVSAAVAACLLGGSLPAATSPAATSTAATSTVGGPPARVIVIPDNDIGSGAALAPDGTIFHLHSDELHVYGPGASGIDPPAKVITGLNAIRSSPPSFSPSAGLATVVNQDQLAVVVIDPTQPGGPVAPVRIITGPRTKIGYPTGVTWGADGSMWVVDGDVNGQPGGELLHFPPGADGDAAPDRVIAGRNTDLTDLSGYGGLTVDTLPDGSVVVGTVGILPGVLVFGPGQTGDVAPIRRLTPSLPGTSYAQLGVATDSLGRIYVAKGDLEGRGWGTLAVYAPGARGADEASLELTGPGTGLHTVALPSVAADDGVLVSDLTFVAGSPAAGRLLEFAPLPVAPSAPRSLKAKQRRTSVLLTWRPPWETGGAQVTGYQITIRKGTRTVRTVNVAAARRRHVVPIRRLPKGLVKFQVTAINAAGPGPFARTRFRN